VCDGPAFDGERAADDAADGAEDEHPEKEFGGSVHESGKLPSTKAEQIEPYNRSMQCQLR
jgi:hypothetical protein